MLSIKSNIVILYTFLLIAVNKAYKMLDDPEQVEYCQGVWEEAKATVDSKVCVCVCVCVCNVFI